MLEQILKMLGVSSAEEAMSAISRWNGLLESLMQSTGAKTGAEALSVVTTLMGSTGAQGHAAIAKVEAFKQQAERTEKLEAELLAVRKAEELRQADSLIETACREMRLRPAAKDKAHEMYTQFGMGALTAFLAAFPVAAPPGPDTTGAPAQAAPTTGAPKSDELTEEEERIRKVMGRSKAEMLEARKLWAEMQGVVPEERLRELNKKTSLLAPRGV